ncbi:MAG TPA: formyltransferase family protein [Gaiellaceae bacterium]|nr:formyltransferase family protein [Gaiellaceae bacterium]
MRVVLISEIAPAVEGLSAMLRAEGHEPVALLCVRHDADRYTDLGDLMRAAPAEIDVVMPSSRDRIAPLLGQFEPDVALCIGFPWKIPADALAVPTHGIVNGHPSLLPRFRGPSPVAWAIRQGETEIGFTFHYMDAELDTGNVLARERIPLHDEYGWDELTPKLATAVGEMLPRVLERVERGDPGEPQDESQASYFRLFDPEYAWIDTSRTVAEVERQVRAWRFHSAADPRGALVALDGETIRVLRVSRVPGEGHTLECADGVLRIVESEPA